MTTRQLGPSRLQCAYQKLMTQILQWSPKRRAVDRNVVFAATGPVEALEVRPLLTTVLIDYSLDTNNFFDTQAKKDLLQTVANSLAGSLADQLLAITPGPSGSGLTNTWEAQVDHPGTGAELSIRDMSVAANTIVIFAGGRDLPGSTLAQAGPGGFSSSGTTEFNNIVAARGQIGALLAKPTDFGLWGGDVTFDTVTNWHFGLTTVGLDPNESDFFSTAQHELGHLLGIGTAKSWENQVTGGAFTGKASVASFGGPVPLAGDLSHWANDTLSNGQQTTMSPSLLEGTRTPFTDLDFAALKDIGWQIAPTVTDAPVATSATFNTAAGTAVNGTLTGTVAAGKTPTFSRVTAPQNGTATVSAGGAFTYTPNANFSGTDTFTFKVNDGTADSNVATVTVKVGTVINTAPVATDGEDVTEQDVEFEGALNDLVTDTEGNPLTFVVVRQPTNGTVDVAPNGDFVYTPDDGFNGVDSFTFKANDGLLDSNIAEFLLTVGEVSGDFSLQLSSTPGVIGISTKTVVPLDPTASLVDIDASDILSNPSISVNIIENRDKRDKILITKGMGNGQNVEVKGTKIFVNKEFVGRTSNINSGAGLKITFNSEVEVSIVNAVLQRISLKSTKSSSNTARTVEMLVETDDGRSSSAKIKASKA